MTTETRIRAAARKLIERYGLINLSVRDVCEAVQIKEGSFAHYAGCTFSEFVSRLNAEGITGPDRAIKKSRVHPDLRKAHVLKTAVGVAKEIGFQNMTRAHVAKQAGVSNGLISHLFGSMSALQSAVMEKAIQMEALEIVAQGLAVGNAIALGAPLKLQEKAVESLLKRGEK